MGGVYVCLYVCVLLTEREGGRKGRRVEGNTINSIAITNTLCVFNQALQIPGLLA
jgi:hypothetical protein